MARAHIYKIFQNADGSVLTGATVRVIDVDDTDPLADSLYTTDAGSSTLSNPFVSDDGKVEFYLDNPQRIRLGVTPVGGSEFFVITDVFERADLVVVASVPNFSLGTPVVGFIPKVNGSGQIEWIDPATLGGSGSAPLGVCTIDATFPSMAFTYSTVNNNPSGVAFGSEFGDHDITILPDPFGAGGYELRFSASGEPALYQISMVGGGVITGTPSGEIYSLTAYLAGTDVALSGSAISDAGSIFNCAGYSSLITSGATIVYPFGAGMQTSAGASRTIHGGSGAGSDWGLALTVARFALPS